MNYPLSPDRAPAEVSPGAAPEPEKQSLSTAEAETFFTEGQQAWPPACAPVRGHSWLKRPEDTCCIGTDVPEVGLVHSYDCPVTDRPVLRASRAYDAGVVPEPLRSFVDGTVTARDLSCDQHAAVRPFVYADVSRNEDRAALLIKLLFAARRLAESRIIGGQVADERGDLKAIATPWCLECQMTERGGRIPHGESCRAGTVLRILEELEALVGPVKVFEFKRKEAATGDEGSGAGAGIRPRAGSLIDAARELRDAALAQIVQYTPFRIGCEACGSSASGLDKSAADILHGAGCWVGNALIVLSSADIDGEAQGNANVVRPQPIDLLCMQCGERGGTWEQGPAISCKGWTLDPNQRVAVDAAGTGRYIWTHRCQKGGVQ